MMNSHIETVLRLAAGDLPEKEEGKLWVLAHGAGHNNGCAPPPIDPSSCLTSTLPLHLEVTVWTINLLLEMNQSWCKDPPQRIPSFFTTVCGPVVNPH